MNINYVKALVIGAVADGEASEDTQALAKLCVTSDLLRQEQRELTVQARDILRDRRCSREWTVNEPVVTCRDTDQPALPSSMARQADSYTRQTYSA